MRIAQITDLHIGKPGECPNGVDVRKNFLNVLNDIKRYKCSYIVITGDLCFTDPDSEVYSWIKEELNRSEIKYDVISGNHDDSKMVAEAFGYQTDNENQLYYKRKYKDWMFLFLDTSTSCISDRQIKVIQASQKDDKLLIFTHYPLLTSGVKYMDRKYPFKDTSKINRILNSAPKSLNVFTGHYHVDKTIIDKNINLFITPSTYFQIDQESDEFGIDNIVPGWRVIEIKSNCFHTAVHYINKQ